MALAASETLMTTVSRSVINGLIIGGATFNITVLLGVQAQLVIRQKALRDHGAVLVTWRDLQKAAQTP